ncbi:SDR family oxidoreductase [Afipia sp. GAS231]|uniref:SDR family oxidoreductase n=1 Tax=Afipia sp. GAS231 TaxID=1882747 RepID=UPI00087D152E|nr:SDR family oxidoreductase [Afipia sp. GAS231]SDN81109.1 NAD(P)-dependent dehydrogenase, short-chain alcohol dehydrogenase family [Afipia sp. GAS231]
MAALQGKTAVVTGGSRGFGRGIVESLAAEGMRVVAIARNEDGLAALKREVKGDIATASGDVTDAIFAARVIEREKPDVLVLNAGARGLNRPTRLHSWETFSTQLNVDVKSAFIWTREALMLPLPKGSAIIVGSSGAALRPMFVNASYAAAKSALWAFAQGVAGEAQQSGIRVHCLLPVMAPDSEVGREALKDFSKYTGMAVEKIIEDKGMKPPVTPAIVGKAVVEILTDPVNAEIVGFRITGAGLHPIKQG